MKRIKQLSEALLKVHKSLLEYQKHIQEDLDQRRLSAHDLLQSCINHPDYEWLRKISTLIAMVDEIDDGPEETKEILLKEVREELFDIFIDETKYLSMKERIELAMSKDPHLCLEMVLLKKEIGQVL